MFPNIKNRFLQKFYEQGDTFINPNTSKTLLKYIRQSCETCGELKRSHISYQCLMEKAEFKR